MEGAEQWVTRQWSEVTRPSADCQTTFIDVSSQRNWEIFWIKVVEQVTRQWSEVRRPLADCQTTFFYVSSNSRKFWRKSLNGHVTSDWRSRTVGRLSNNIFWRCQAIRKKFVEKSRWTVTRQCSEVTRPSADCQTTFFGRSKQLRKIFGRRSLDDSRDSGRRSRDRRPTVKQRFLDVSSN